MVAQAVIEIVPAGDGRVPTELLCDLYRASVTGVVVLVLNGVRWQDVDAALDWLVARFPLDIPGLVYLDIADAGAVVAAARDAPRICGVSQQFRQILRPLQRSIEQAESWRC